MGRICSADPYERGTAVYLSAVLAFGRHWYHRLRAMSYIAERLGMPAGEAALPYKVDANEARMLLSNGMAPALSLFLEHIGPEVTKRQVWPEEWLEQDDPLQDWGLGAVAARALRVMASLCSAKPVGLMGLEWPENDLMRHGAQLARGGLGGSGGAVMAGMVGLCINAAVSFPSVARSVPIETIFALHMLANRAHHPHLRQAAGVAACHISTAGLRGLLGALMTTRRQGSGRGGAGGSGALEATRREAALQCLLKLLAAAQHSGALKAALETEWPLLMSVMTKICAPALQPQPSSSASPSSASSATRTGLAATRRGGGSSSSTTGSSSAASMGLVVEGFTDLVDSCRRQESVGPVQIGAAVSLLLSVAGVGPKGSQSQVPGQQQQQQQASSSDGRKTRQQAQADQEAVERSAAAEALRNAAVESLCRHGSLLSVWDLINLLPKGVEGGAPSPSTSPASGSGTSSTPPPTAWSQYSWPATSRLLPRGVQLLLTWFGTGSARQRAGEGAGAHGGVMATAAGGEGVPLEVLYSYVRQPLWRSVRNLEDVLRVAPGNSATLCLRGNEEVEGLLAVVSGLLHGGRVLAGHAVNDLVAEGGVSALARCVFLRRAVAVILAMQTLTAACGVAGAQEAAAAAGGSGRFAAGGMRFTGGNAPVEPESAAGSASDPGGGSGGAAADQYNGCLSQGTQQVLEVMRKKQRTVAPMAASAGSPSPGSGAGGGGGKAPSYGYVQERPLDRLVLLATDPQVAGLEMKEGPEEADALVAVQMEALRAVAALLAAGDIRCGLELLAAPSLVGLLSRLGEQSQPQSQGGDRGAAAGFPQLRREVPSLWWALASVLCGLSAAVPRWQRAAAAAGGGGALVDELCSSGTAGGGGGSSGAAAAAAAKGSSSRRRNKGDKKGGAGAAPPAVQQQQQHEEVGPNVTPAAVRSGVRAAAELLLGCAPGSSLLEPAISTAKAVEAVLQRTDPVLYGILAAATAVPDRPYAVLYDPSLRAARGTQLKELADEMGAGADGPDAAAGGAAVDGEDEVVIVSQRIIQTGAGSASSSSSTRGGGAASSGAAARRGVSGGATADADAGPAAKACAQCGRRPGDPGVTKLRKCAGCLAVRYCSQACQAAAWPSHRPLCQAAAAAAAAQGDG